jgi:hypothetical protein
MYSAVLFIRFDAFAGQGEYNTCFLNAVSLRSLYFDSIGEKGEAGWKESK